MLGQSTSPVYWTCTALAGKAYFQGYGTSREPAFERAMKQCRFGAHDPTNCIGGQDRCMPPNPQN